jgi:hypothetical protein
MQYDDLSPKKPELYGFVILYKTMNVIISIIKQLSLSFFNVTSYYQILDKNTIIDMFC